MYGKKKLYEFGFVCVNLCFVFSNCIFYVHMCVQVMDDGWIVEYDEPGILLQDPNSLLKTMVDRTGPSVSCKLYQIAMEMLETRKGAK